MTRMVVAVLMTAAAALAQSPASALAVAPVSLSSAAAIRGQRLYATVVNPPAGQTQAQVYVGSSLQDATIETGGRIPFVVPGETSAHQPFPVGNYPVLIKIAGDLFPAGRLAVVRDIGSLADATLRVKLDSVEPSYIQRKEKYVSFVARGRNFATDLPADNQLILNRAPYTGIAWDDGCRVSGLPSPPPAKDSAPPPVHATAISSEELHFCNIPLPASGDLGVVIRQGTEQSEQRVLPVRDWSKLGLMFFAGLVSALAVALVLALVANLKGSYFIKNQAYVLRALYLDTESDTYSLSKAQFYAWTIAALFAYSFFVLSKLIVQKTLTIPDVPGSLPGIIAIGAGTAVTAQFLSNVRGPKGAGDELPAISDFVTSGGVVAPERVQMVVWTLFGVIAFLLATILRDPTTIEGLPSVPDGLLYLSGISSLGYLSGKLTRKPGPVIAELSITPSQPSSELDTQPVGAPLLVNAGAALAAAQQILLQLDAAPGVSSNAAVTALGQAIAATANISTAANAAPVITQLATLRANAEAAATASAAEFDRLASAVPPDSGAAAAGRAAELAQEATAALQDLSTAVTQVTSIATPHTPALDTASASKSRDFQRIIDIRGRNLSVDATFEICGLELPFRMLTNPDGSKRPLVAAREEDTASQGMARELKLVIVPALLDSSDQKNYDAWFANSRTDLKLTMFNPDGQKAVISFSIPPSASQVRS